MLLFSTDIDGTVHDGADAAARFAAFWLQTRRIPSPPLLVYNTGRSLDDTLSLIRRTALPAPDFIIAGVGTEIYNCANEQILTNWHQELAVGWDLDKVKRVILEQIEGIEAQPPECQNPFKCSWFWHDRDTADLDRLCQLLQETGLDAQVIYSSSRDLDILPQKANKGNAIHWLVQWLGIPLEQVVVAGDSGNDASMLLLEGVTGILVGNAEEALLEAAAAGNPIRVSGSCADGVINALRPMLEKSFAPEGVHTGTKYP